MNKNDFKEPDSIANHIYVTPMKLVKNMDDMVQWDKSEAYFEYLGFLYAINDSIKGKSNSQGSANASERINKLVGLLDTINNWIDMIPPIQQPQRFGNKAFRDWYNKLKDVRETLSVENIIGLVQEEAIPLLQTILPEYLFRAIPEIMVYLVDGFGNATRIDYGTGHELSFVMFLCSLFKIEYLKTEDQPALACKVFVRYLDLVRNLQVTYRMEPAGSHGVWSLDDYQFVPFIWGSSQFIGNPKFEPNCFLKDTIVEAYSSEYMFLSCIQYINLVKSGPFAEHSNQLWSISGVSTWSKINTGLIKMYRGEGLSKFPLVQHIYFGSLFTLKQIDPGASSRRPRLSSTGPPVLPLVTSKHSAPTIGQPSVRFSFTSASSRPIGSQKSDEGNDGNE